jgi:hypothetical protein
MIRCLPALLLAVLLTSCGSQSWKITLKDGRTFTALNEPVLQRKTGYYRYEAENGRDAMLQAHEVLMIERTR